MTFRDRHHRRPRSMGGDNSDRNISIVNAKQHRAYHVLFFNKDPIEIARLLNEYWIDPDWHFIAVKIGEEK